MLSTKQAAARLGITVPAVVYLIRRNLIAAEKVGRDWIIAESEVERYATERRPAHRPKRRV